MPADREGSPPGGRAVWTKERAAEERGRERRGKPARLGPTARASAESSVFAALASPVRREILARLLTGPLPVNELAARFDMARPSVSEHLRVLLDAGLVEQTRSGRRRLYELRPDPLAELRDWLHPYERFWRNKLRTLHQMLDEEDAEEPNG